MSIVELDLLALVLVIIYAIAGCIFLSLKQRRITRRVQSTGTSLTEDEKEILRILGTSKEKLVRASLMLVGGLSLFLISQIIAAINHKL